MGMCGWSAINLSGKENPVPTSTSKRVKPLTTDRSPTTPAKPARKRKASPATTAPGAKTVAGRTKASVAPARTKPTQRVLDAIADHAPQLDGKTSWDANLTAEQSDRALTCPDGLRGKAAARYVETGERPSDVARHREQERAAAAAAGRSTRASSGPRAGSALAAALTVLAASSEPMRPDDIYAEAKRLGLVAGLKGKTPAATLAAQLATANKAERYVMRPAPGVYALRTA
jgi:hypothetical protein